MDGIEKITDRISSDTDQEVKSVLENAETEAAEIRSSYETLTKTESAQVLQAGKAAAAERVERLGGVAELEARKRLLAVRQEMLDEAFSTALQQLLNLPEADYVALLAALAADGCTSGCEALVLSVVDRSRYGKRVVNAANEILAASGRTAALTLSEESREFSGGLYIQDGKIENNCTFPTILRILREQMAGEVAKILFD